MVAFPHFRRSEACHEVDLPGENYVTLAAV
jgi:hypothetical protein